MLASLGPPSFTGVVSLPKPKETPCPVPVSHLLTPDQNLSGWGRETSRMVCCSSCKLDDSTAEQSRARTVTEKKNRPPNFDKATLTAYIV